MKKFLNLIVLSAILSFSGCVRTSKYMKTASYNGIPAEVAGKATVVFYRPDIFAGSAIQSSVFDVTTEENIIVGILPAGNKIIYITKPGDALFMVAGENADFLKLPLEAEKIYYIKMTTAMGAFKARFHLKEITETELQDKMFKEALDNAVTLEKSEDTEKWAEDNAKSIRSKREKYYKKWTLKTADRENEEN